MSELTLVLSEKFTEGDAKSLRAALGRRLQVGNPMFVVRASSDPPSNSHGQYDEHWAFRRARKLLLYGDVGGSPEDAS